MTLDYWKPSRSGKYVAYGLSEGGDEMATIHVKDVEKNEDLPDTIVNCRHSSIRWLPDDSAFFYTCNPRKGTVPKGEEHLHTKVYLHRLGDDSDVDQLIFGEGRPKDDMINLSISIDGRYLGIEVRSTWTENDVYIYDRSTEIMRPIISGIPANFSVRFLNDKILMHTDYKANNYRLISTGLDDLYKPIDEWREFIGKRGSLLQSVNITKDRILVEYLVNACSEITAFDHDGLEVGKIPLPAFSSLSSISTNREESEFFYAVESFTFPVKIYHFDPSKGTGSIYRETDNPVDPSSYEVRQEWFVSKDETRVPMFVFYKKGIVQDGHNPLILYGYGGFGDNQKPGFMRNWVPWLERGGVFAIANIRGGGEFGERWHKDGIKKNKQNSFDDFIAAAEHLISMKYTDSAHLGILGGSNGGLLVTAVAIQRLDLFRAVCSRVPLTDMIRFQKFGMALRWIHEYGDPTVKEDFERIMTWSPYHNVKESVEYPHFLFTTADNDTRVNPLHARKMTAALQAANKENKVFLFTEMDAGHGSGKPISKIIDSQALTLSFFSQNLGLANL